MLLFYWMSRIKIEEYIIRVPRLARDVIRFPEALFSTADVIVCIVKTSGKKLSLFNSRN